MLHPWKVCFFLLHYSNKFKYCFFLRVFPVLSSIFEFPMKSLISLRKMSLKLVRSNNSNRTEIPTINRTIETLATNRINIRINQIVIKIRIRIVIETQTTPALILLKAILASKTCFTFYVKVLFK